MLFPLILTLNFEKFLCNSVQSKCHCAEILTTHTAVRLSRLMGYFKFYEIYYSDIINYFTKVKCLWLVVQNIFSKLGRCLIALVIDALDGEESLLGGKLAAFANQGKANKRVRCDVLVTRL